MVIYRLVQPGPPQLATELRARHGNLQQRSGPRCRKTDRCRNCVRHARHVAITVRNSISEASEKPDYLAGKPLSINDSLDKTTIGAQPVAQNRQALIAA